MSELKADIIQPINSSNNLVIRTGSDAERMRIDSSGNITILGNFGLGITGNVSHAGNLNVNGTATFPTVNITNMSVSGTVSGNLAISGKATSSSTSTSDTSTTLTTKSYVDSFGPVLFNNAVTNVISVNLSSTHTARQTLELHPTVPETAKYVILYIHALAFGNTPYNIWFGNSTTVNTGHRTHYQTETGNGDVSTNTVRVMLPMHKISASSRRVYWNISATPGTANDDLFADIAGYVV